MSAFYFAHRDSKDFDFFCSETFDMRVIGGLLRSIATDMGAEVEEKIATQTYKEVYIKHPSGWIQRIDVVRRKNET